MSKFICPHCGSHNIQALHAVAHPMMSTQANMPKVLHSIVSYALMGAATAQKFRSNRQPWVLLAGVAVGGVIGCVVSYLNSSHPQADYYCQACQQSFNLDNAPATTFSQLWS